MEMRRCADAAQRTVTADPQFSFAWLLLGNLQVGMNKEDQGIESLKKSIQLGPSDPARYELVTNELMKRHRSNRRWKSGEPWPRPIQTTRPQRCVSPESSPRKSSIQMRRRSWSRSRKKIPTTKRF